MRVTQIHDGEIKELTRNMMKIVEVLDFMAEYNPGLLMMKIEELYLKTGTKKSVSTLVRVVTAQIRN